jgi:hypothetical protein
MFRFRWISTKGAKLFSQGRSLRSPWERQRTATKPQRGEVNLDNVARLVTSPRCGWSLRIFFQGLRRLRPWLDNFAPLGLACMQR